MSEIERVKLLRKEYELQRKGYRDQLVRIICLAFRQAQKISKSNQKRKEFYDLVGVRPRRRKTASLVTEMMVYVICAKTKVKRQRAWKYGRALKFLFDTGTALASLEREVGKRGGLEEVVKEAAKKKPLRRTKDLPLLHCKPPLMIGENSSKPANSKVGDGDRANDQTTTLAVEIQMSDLDELRELMPGKRVNLVTTRLKSGRHLLTVNRVLRKQH